MNKNSLQIIYNNHNKLTIFLNYFLNVSFETCLFVKENKIIF